MRKYLTAILLITSFGAFAQNLPTVQDLQGCATKDTKQCRAYFKVAQDYCSKMIVKNRAETEKNPLCRTVLMIEWGAEKS